VDDATLCILVEYVNSGELDCDLDSIACSCLGTRRNTSDKVLIFILSAGSNEVEVDLSAHKLCNFNVSCDDGIRHSLEVTLLVVETLRTNTEDDFLAYLILESRVVCLLFGKLKAVLTEYEVEILTLLNKLALDEVHLRSSDKSGNEYVYREVVKILR